MSAGFCNYIGAECEVGNDALRCAKVSAVKCRNRRERIAKEKRDAAIGDALSDVVHGDFGSRSEL